MLCLQLASKFNITCVLITSVYVYRRFLLQAVKSKLSLPIKASTVNCPRQEKKEEVERN